jgi:hypothetical protein
MDERTKSIIDALRAVSGRAEPVANALMLNSIPPKDQRVYANMLRELSDLMHQHADDQEIASETTSDSRSTRQDSTHRTSDF